MCRVFSRPVTMMHSNCILTLLPSINRIHFFCKSSSLAAPYPSFNSAMQDATTISTATPVTFCHSFYCFLLQCLGYSLSPPSTWPARFGLLCIAFLWFLNDSNETHAGSTTFELFLSVSTTSVRLLVCISCAATS